MGGFSPYGANKNIFTKQSSGIPLMRKRVVQRVGGGGGGRGGGVSDNPTPGMPPKYPLPEMRLQDPCIICELTLN